MLAAPLLLILTVGGGCDRASPEPSTVPAAKAPVAARSGAPSKTHPDPSKGQQSQAKSPATSVEYRKKAAARIVAIGDLHGDFSATKRAFATAGAIDAKGAWVGGELVVVQTGDQLDRGDDEREIIEFLQRLEKEASQAGGALIVLNGNHEVMNVMGDFRYVTPGALDAFSNDRPVSPLADRVSPPYRGRAGAFLPGGAGAQIFSERPVIVMVGSTVFVHGGVLLSHVDYGIDRLNRESKEWMLGHAQRPPEPLLDPEGPLWTRLYGPSVLDAEACKVLGETLTRLGAERMVVGHTVQDRGMSGACDGQVYRIDVGLSHAYGDRAVQVLEIKGKEVKILTEGAPLPTETKTDARPAASAP